MVHANRHNPMLPYLGRLVEVKDLATEIKLFRVELLNGGREAFANYRPGQFAFVSAFGVGEAPFGIASTPHRTPMLEFAVNRLGAVTTGLHELGAGDVVGVRRPMGNAFPMEAFKGKNLIVLGGAYAYLFPIDWPEPFGLTMAESLATGTPVVAWRSGSVPEVVVDGVTGFVRDDMDGMVRAVEEVAGVDRAACRAHAERFFSGEAMADGYEAVYAAVLQSGGFPALLPARERALVRFVGGERPEASRGKQSA